MSEEYIYGSSLKAAKSKAKYLFEGEFRRKPNQNLSGASRSRPISELLQEAAEQRQNRQGLRKRDQSALIIQSFWRSYSVRNLEANKMRIQFDNIFKNTANSPIDVDDDDFYILLSKFLVYFHSQKDKARFDVLIEFLLKQKIDSIRTECKTKQDETIFLRILKLTRLCLFIMRHEKLGCSPSYIQYLYYLTKQEDCCFTETQTVKLWYTLVKTGFYLSARQWIDDFANKNDTNLLPRQIQQLVVRSLDIHLIDPTTHILSVKYIVASFFKDFLKGPLSNHVDFHVFPQLLRIGPVFLKPSYVLQAFERISNIPYPISLRVINPLNIESLLNEEENDRFEEIASQSIWLLFCFVRATHQQLISLTEHEKIIYLDVLKTLIEPAEVVTDKSLLLAAKNEEDDDNDDRSTVFYTKYIQDYYADINKVITRTIQLLNVQMHVDQLKQIVLDSRTFIYESSKIAVIRLCSLMLRHEPMAIFNCKLLYSVGFNKEFLRNLWRSLKIYSGDSGHRSLFSTPLPVCTQICRGDSIEENLLFSFLSSLDLFCFLYSYLLPTIDDEEFYNFQQTNTHPSTDPPITHRRHESTIIIECRQGNKIQVDMELVDMCSTLRDMCIGMIDILYNVGKISCQSNNNGLVSNSSKQPYSLFAQAQQTVMASQTKIPEMFTFKLKSGLKLLVKLINQLYIRDVRRQFCPTGHWICPSIVIPTNKLIQFEMINSQQGRLLDQITTRHIESSACSHSSLIGSDNKPKSIYQSNEMKTIILLQEIPFVMSFDERVKIFHHLLRKERQEHITEGYHYGIPGTAIRVQIRRNFIYEDAFDKLLPDHVPNYKMPFKITLINAAGAEEAGIDGGGLTKEFLSELLKTGFDPMRGFFKSTKDNFLYPNPSVNVLFSALAEGYEAHYEFLGRMLGKAIFEKIIIELPLANFFLAKLLAREHFSDVDLHHLASLDPVLYKNLVYLKNYPNDVSDLNLDFTIANNEFGEQEIVELKADGRKIPVTRDNRVQYVHLVADYRLNKQTRIQCAAFKRGLSQLIDLDWLRMFDPHELQILISGAPTSIDIDDWRKHTVYANGYSDDCKTIEVFWKVVSEFDEAQRRRLLKFATSCSLPPLLGFKDLVPQFAIAPSEEVRLPSASTCMNMLKLPNIEEEQVMKTKILYAIDSNSGFELS